MIAVGASVGADVTVGVKDVVRLESAAPTGSAADV
jgi:hypothetical protein